jgi:hypothetical protein
VKASATLANAAWCAASLPAYRRFMRAAQQVETVQRARLDHYLRANAASEFGREHDFASIADWETWAERVPMRSFEELSPWLDKVAHGDDNVLTAERVRLLEPSSGSTGARKLLPYTAGLQQEFREGVAVWISALFRAHPALATGRAYWSLTPKIEVADDPQRKVPVGFDEDAAYLGGLAQRVIERTLVSHSALRDISDMDDFWLATLLLLLRARDLRLVSVWHPSYLTILLEKMVARWDELLHYIEHGCALANGRIRISADACLAGQLAAIGRHDTRAIWPDLTLVSCWGDAHAASYLPALRKTLPGIEIQPKGLIATEGIVSLPLGDKHPLAVTSHFFEFVDKAGNVLPAWRLSEGEIYSVVLTTSGGLYRYRLQDEVRVDGRVGDVPSLMFVGKEHNVSDHRGEKLSEAFVIEAIAAACAAASVQPSFAMLAPRLTDGALHYCLFVEGGDIHGASLAEALEAELCTNPHYGLCRKLEQLGSVGVQIVSDAHEKYCRRLVESHKRLGDIKPAALSSRSGWSDWLAD